MTAVGEAAAAATEIITATVITEGDTRTAKITADASTSREADIRATGAVSREEEIKAAEAASGHPGARTAARTTVAGAGTVVVATEAILHLAINDNLSGALNLISIDQENCLSASSSLVAVFFF